MKSIKVLWLLLGIPAILCSFMSVRPNGVTEEKVILISPEQMANPNAPRSVSPGISAYYDTVLSCIFVTISNAGTLVDVYIENTTTGETAAYQIPGSGSSIMPISGTSGYWSITFTLSTSDVYCGYFAL